MNVTLLFQRCLLIILILMSSITNKGLGMGLCVSLYQTEQKDGYINRFPPNSQPIISYLLILIHIPTYLFTRFTSHLLKGTPGVFYRYVNICIYREVHIKLTVKLLNLTCVLINLCSFAYLLSLMHKAFERIGSLSVTDI